MIIINVNKNWICRLNFFLSFKMNETAKRLPTPRSRGLPVSVEFQLTVYYRKFNYLDGISRLVAGLLLSLGVTWLLLIVRQFHIPA